MKLFTRLFNKEIKELNERMTLLEERLEYALYRLEERDRKIEEIIKTHTHN